MDNGSNTGGRAASLQPQSTKGIGGDIAPNRMSLFDRFCCRRNSPFRLPTMYLLGLLSPHRQPPRGCPLEPPVRLFTKASTLRYVIHAHEPGGEL